MRSIPVLGFGTALLITAIALPPVALAQSPPPAATTHTASHPPAALRAGEDPTKRVEQRIADLHKRLQITAEQQPQWEQFAQVMRDNAHNMGQALQQRAADAATMNAVQNMQSYAQLAQQHAEDVQKLASAFQSLYGSLSDTQKKAADQAFREAGTRRRG